MNTADLQAKLDAANRLIESQAQTIYQYQHQFSDLNRRYKDAVERIREVEDELQAREVAA